MVGVGFVPLTEVVCYANVLGYERITDFIAIIRAMDDVFVKHQNDKADDGRSQASTHD